jgi:hypothetical protein
MLKGRSTAYIHKLFCLKKEKTMNTKRFIAMLLAVMMSVAALASCAGSDDDTPVTRPTSENSDDGTDFIEADFDGDEFVFLAADPDDYSSDQGNRYYAETLDPESVSGNLRDNAAFERNLAVEEKYNVEIKTILCTNPAAELSGYYMSGDICFDVIYGWANRLGAQITQNYFYDWYDVDNIDLEAEYWSPSAIDDLTIADRLFLCTNDTSINKLAHAEMLFFNKQILEEYNLTSPHDYVDSDTWTVDQYLEMVKAVSEELDGDNKFTKNDRYGLLNESFVSLMAGAGMSYTDKSDDGTYTVAIGSEKVINFLEKVKTTLSDTSHVISLDTIRGDGEGPGEYNDIWEYARSYFATGHSLFITGNAKTTEEFRDMEDPYGVVPLPKYDTTQDRYYATVDSCACIFAIPFDPRNIEMTGIIMEYMAYKSNELYIPAYYETTIKTQRMQDEKDQEMLDIIKNSTRYEWTDIISAASSDGNPFSTTIKTMYSSRGMASSYKRSETKLVNTLNDWYDELAAVGTTQ